MNHMDKNDRIFLVAQGCLMAWIGVAFVPSGWFDLHSPWLFIYLLLPLLAAVVIWSIRPTDLSAALNQFMKAWFNIFWSYNLLVTLNAVLLLVGLSAVGYLPYSDRPSPDWSNIAVHLPTFDEIGYFTGWTLLLLPTTCLMGTTLFVFMAWIRWLNAPVWLARILGAIFCSGFSMIAVASAGWYISIAVSVTNIVGLYALPYGAFILPRVAPRRELPLSPAARAGCVVLAFLSMAGLLVLPFIRGR